MYWNGRNKLWWRNKVVLGRSWTPVLITSSLININAILFLIFVIPYFVKKYTVTVVILPVYLQIFSTWLLVVASVMDPGIIPRRIINMHKRYYGSDIFYRINHLCDDFKLKFWSTCWIMRPPRVSHWSTWDNWVMRWDHHCPWMGTWIGIRNFKYFFWFLFHQFWLSLLNFMVSLIHLFLIADESYHNENNSYTIDWVNTLKYNPVSLILWVFNIPAVGFVGSLFFYQIYLWSRDLTSNEYMKQYYADFPYTPYSTGSNLK